jgi:hypothetical protein
MDLIQYGVVESDLDLLRRKSVEGSLIKKAGERNTVGEITSYTPATGKRFVLVGASISVETSPVTGNLVVQLKNDGTVVDEFGSGSSSSFAANGFSGQWSINHYSIVRGDTLLGDGAKKYSIDSETNSASYIVHGRIFGFIEDI